MKVSNMTSTNGNAIPNQFIITEKGNGANGNFIKKEVFQSYQSVICERIIWDPKDCEGFRANSIDITLDRNKWDYSTTTGKYRNQFLRETKKETERKIASGEYILADLN